MSKISARFVQRVPARTNQAASSAMKRRTTEASNAGSQAGSEAASALAAPSPALDGNQRQPVQSAAAPDAYTKELAQLQARFLSPTPAPFRSTPAQRGELVQRAAVGPEGGAVSGEVQRQLDAARGGGQALDRQAGQPVSDALGVDFSGVHVHTDERADALSRALSARAFTRGSDIFFRRGAYQPGTSGGKELLAHELTHVAQQGAAAQPARPWVQAKLTVGPAEDAYEREADAVAEQVARMAVLGPARRPHAAPYAVTNEIAINHPPALLRPTPAGHAAASSTIQRTLSEEVTTPESPQEQPRESAPDKPAPSLFALQLFANNKKTLRERIVKIKPLNASSEFQTGINGWLQNLWDEHQKIQGGETAKDVPINTEAIANIVKGLEGIYGFEVPYDWFLENQDIDNFAEDLRIEAYGRTGRGRLWSKLNVRSSMMAAEQNRGILLESTVAGWIFNGLSFGFRWGQSRATGELWNVFSPHYVRKLHGIIEADVLNGVHPNSVLNTKEWAEVSELLRSHRVQKMLVNYYSFEDHRLQGPLEPTDVRTVKNQQDWNALTPTANMNDPEWKRIQGILDINERTLRQFEELFGRQKPGNESEIEAALAEWYTVHHKEKKP